MSYISAIEIAVPEFCHTQDAITSFYENTTLDLNARRKIRLVSSRAGIETRYSVLSDYSKTPENFSFFEKNKTVEPEPNLTKRMGCFREEAIKLSLKAVNQIKHFGAIKASITHIITVTCTGLFTPGLEIQLIRSLGLNSNTHRLPINFMGCNAAILALNSADSICKSNSNAKVLVVCTELCTIHFQKNYSDDYIMSTALFGDGSAALLIEAQPPITPFIKNLKIKSFQSLLIDKGFNEMAWQITEKGFIMNLSSYVSQFINGEMKSFFSTLKIEPSQIKHWAVHPGGKRILEEFSETLNIETSLIKESYEVLRRYGNMSSVTVLFVLKSLVVSRHITKNETILTVAFGPGLSVETMQLEYV